MSIQTLSQSFEFVVGGVVVVVSSNFIFGCFVVEVVVVVGLF